MPKGVKVARGRGAKCDVRRMMRKNSTITSGPEPEDGAVESPPRETIRKPTGRRNDPGNEWNQSEQAPWSKAMIPLQMSRRTRGHS